MNDKNFIEELRQGLQDTAKGGGHLQISKNFTTYK